MRAIVVVKSLASFITLALLGPLCHAQNAGGGALARMARSGTVQVGYIPTPGTFAFRDAAGHTVGYSIDVCMKVVEALRKQLGRPDLRVEFRPLEAAQRIPLLKAGSIDLECGGNTNTVGRQKEVDFSHTLFTTGVRFLARDSVQLDGGQSLWRRRIAVSNGTTAQETVQREQEIAMTVVATDAEGVRLVEEGRVDAFAQDDILLYGLIAASAPRDRLHVTGRHLTVEPYAFMLPKDDAPLREVVDRTVLGLMHSGELAALYRKWFDTALLRIPMSAHMRENIRYPNKHGIP
ncbi:amino acid ABC transporter substrate-binding protein [Acidovorax sp.]|jgi:glutamate/aspartate transport system substrate-binding protein|uniref:amino acid ABC transporter substrate-binding protein n=1 Tax=Acidovorax sp. TaxID=1872122 RepID=UPI00391F872C